jgi:hypothetical protein
VLSPVGACLPEMGTRILPPVRLEQRHGHQAQLRLLFFIEIFMGKLHMYILMKIIFKTNLFIRFSHFQTQRLKSYP